MKRIAFIAALFLSIAGAGYAGQASKTEGSKERTWTGLITDTMCAQSHQPNIEHAMETSGKKMTAKECTVGCVARRGQKYVLVSDGKVFQIANQDYAGLSVYAAEMVKMTGSLAGDTIKVSQIAPTAKDK